MKKNKLYSAALSVLLIVPSQVFCAEPPVPQGILDRLNITMPTAPQWLSNLTTNVTSGFSSLSDKTKYLIYGAMAAFLGYIGYKVISSSSSSSSIFMEVPTSMENRAFWNPNYEELSSTANCSNIAYIIRRYDTIKGDSLRELAFKHYVCPVLKAHENELDSKEKWEGFLSDIHKEAFQITMGQNTGPSGLNMFQLMKKTCPNEKITNPLRELLIEKGKPDKEVIKILNQ
jgi:hypothetical protein